MPAKKICAKITNWGFCIRIAKNGLKNWRKVRKCKKNPFFSQNPPKTTKEIHFLRIFCDYFWHFTQICHFHIFHFFHEKSNIYFHFSADFFISKHGVFSLFQPENQSLIHKKNSLINFKPFFGSFASKILLWKSL